MEFAKFVKDRFVAGSYIVHVWLGTCRLVVSKHPCSMLRGG